MIKAEKYRKENIQIEHLFHPPTEAFKPWFTTLSLYLEDDINRRAAALTGDKAIALRMGSEVELNIFANTYDSRVHHRYSREGNPSYTPKHRKTTDEIARDLCATKEEGGLNEILYENYTWLPAPVARKITKDTVFMELRTVPASVSGYIDQMEELGEWLQGEAYARGVRPVVHSQHIHFSLQSADKNLFDRKEKTRKFVNKGLIDIYHRTLPLIRMPEEIEFSGQYDMEYSSSQNIKSKIGNDPRQQTHIEARVNNSEYAFDPYLNLLVQLLGIHRGISHKTKILGYSSLDRDYHLDSRREPGFALKNVKFEERVDHLRHDKVIGRYLPDEVVQSLADVLTAYKSVSEGKMSVGDLRHIANRKAYELDPDMYILGKGR